MSNNIENRRIDNTERKSFVHLHVHDNYSFLDGGGSIKDNVARAKELGMTTIASTNHNHLAGWYDFINECKANNIKPILGCEMYQTFDTEILSLSADERKEYALEQAKKAGVEIPAKVNGKKITKKQIEEIIEPFAYNTKQFHVIFLAMNQVGANNLIKLQSEAADKCTFNGRYNCDFDMIEKYSEGLICLSACLGGIIPYHILNGEINKAREYVLKYKKIFKENFFLEIQPLDDSEQIIVNSQLKKFSEEYDIPLVATNDVHYTLKEDYDDHDTLLCVGIGKKKKEEDRMKYLHEFWIRSYDEMIEAFERNYDIDEDDFIIEAMNNTLLIANKIEDNIKIGSSTPLFPKVYIPEGLTAEQYLTIKSYKKLYEYKKENPEIDIIKYEKRLYSELDIINSKGFAPYMLKIFENIEYAEANDIPVGPGRGSAAGSLCLFLNGGTKVVDPIVYDLLFFRFLTKDRVDPPDVDMDFGYYGRDLLISNLEDIHGHDAVAHIGTFTLLGVKSGLKDFGRVLDIDFNEMNALTKKIDEITDEAPGFKFKEFFAFKDEAEEALKDGRTKDYERFIAKYNAYIELEEKYPELFRLAKKFEGTPRNMGVHPSGVLAMPCSVTDYFPTRTVDGIRIALFTGPQLESLGAIKLDILGLKTLDVLDKTLKSIKKDLRVDDLYKLIKENLDNKKMFDMLQNKETEGIFQLESNLFKGLIGDIIPTHFNDITAITSIGRPGPLSAGMHTQYANRKNGHEVAIPQLHGTEEITQDTFHTIIYQEQCMLIAKKVAKFDDSQADSILRKALAKKKADKMEIARRLFIYGKINTEAPADYDIDNPNQPIYDPKGELGAPVLGGINNGYTEDELSSFWIKLKGYASYLFNKSHAASYSITTLCTMFLKKFYTAKYIAALLSMQDKEEKIELYCKTAKNYDIKIITPDINKSNKDFTEIDGSILYGLKTIKGVGKASLDTLIKERPFNGIEDAVRKLPKKVFNKKTGIALIKAGAFDFEDSNRNILANKFYSIRRDKDDKLIEEDYNKETTIKYEKEVLGTSVTYALWWDEVIDKTQFVQEFTITDITNKVDKKGRKMAFATLEHQGSKIKGVIFASTYNKVNTLLEKGNKVLVSGKRDGESIIVNKMNLAMVV